MNKLIERLKNTSWTGIALMLAMLAGGGLVAFVLVARAVNTAPSQCASCHPEMAALFETGRTHPVNQVSCYECHGAHAELPEGYNILGYVRDYFIPEKYLSADDRLNSRCEGCHTNITRADKEKEKLIKINHKAHMQKPLQMSAGKVALKCVDCHSTVAHDRTQRPTNRPTMAGCFTADCHKEDRKAENCLRCHYQSLLDKVVAQADAAAQAQGETPK